MLSEPGQGKGAAGPGWGFGPSGSAPEQIAKSLQKQGALCLSLLLPRTHSRFAH